MANEKKSSGNYEVGYGKPPKQHRWGKGTSGNPKGRPKSKKRGAEDISAILDQPIKVSSGGKTRTMSTFEAVFRKLAKKAIEGHLPSILKFIRYCEEYDVIAPLPADSGGGVIVAPEGVNFQEWLESVTELVPPDED